MKEDLFKELKARYELAHQTIKAMEKANNDTYWYKIRLVSITVERKGKLVSAYDVKIAKTKEDQVERLLQTVYIDPEEGHGYSMNTVIENLDEVLQDAADLLEKMEINIRDAFKDSKGFDIKLHWLGD